MLLHGLSNLEKAPVKESIPSGKAAFEVPEREKQSERSETSPGSIHREMEEELRNEMSLLTEMHVRESLESQCPNPVFRTLSGK